jgi:hypothetical protein
MKIAIFWGVISTEEAAAPIFRMQDGGNRFLRTTGFYETMVMMYQITVSYPERQ